MPDSDLMAILTEDLIDKGYKLMKFTREIDKINGEEIGVIEVKALDGHREFISLDDNSADEIESKLFQYLKGK